MVLDTSAVVAILLSEPEAPAMIRAIAAAEPRSIGTATLVEASAVMRARKGAGGEIAVDALLERLGIGVEALSVDAARLARLAYARFGKGVGDMNRNFKGPLRCGDKVGRGVWPCKVPKSRGWRGRP